MTGELSEVLLPTSTAVIVSDALERVIVVDEVMAFDARVGVVV